MKEHRFFVSRLPDHTRGVLNEKDTVRQIRTVLRLTKGDTIALIEESSGTECVYTIDRVEKDSLFVSFVQKKSKRPVSLPSVHLYCALLKKENFELVCQKATEIGVATITPMITERVVKYGIKKARVQKIMREAAEQSGRRDIPLLYAPISFQDAIGQNEHGSICVVLDESGDRQIIDPHEVKQKRCVFVGPEGGWNERERAYARTHSCSFLSLGVNTLRAETAAIIGTWRVVHERI